MSFNSDPFNLYLIQQKELYGNSLYIDNNSNELYDLIKSCPKCQGDPYSDIIFIGEEFYLNEEKKDSFLFDQSNQLLKKIFSAVSLSKEDIYITNIIKVFYEKEEAIIEVVQCKKHLEYKLKLAKPRLIVSLGEKSANLLLDNTLFLDEMRSKLFKYKNIDLIVTYNPSTLIKDSNLKKSCWDDFKYIKKKYFD